MRPDGRCADRVAGPMTGPASPFLSHLFVHVRSLPETKAFYVDLLGLEILAGGPDTGYMRVGGGCGFTLGLEDGVDAEIGAPGIEIVIGVDDVDARYAALSRAGVPFDTPPSDQEWGMRHAWLRDPSGYRLSINSPNTGSRSPNTGLGSPG